MFLFHSNCLPCVAICADKSVLFGTEGCCPPLWLPMWQTQQRVHALPLGGEGSPEVPRGREKSQWVCTQLLQVVVWCHIVLVWMDTISESEHWKQETIYKQHWIDEALDVLSEQSEWWKDELCHFCKNNIFPYALAWRCHDIWQKGDTLVIRQSNYIFRAEGCCVVVICKSEQCACGQRVIENVAWLWSQLKVQTVGVHVKLWSEEVCGQILLHFLVMGMWVRECVLRFQMLLLDSCSFRVQSCWAYRRLQSWEVSYSVSSTANKLFNLLTFG